MVRQRTGDKDRQIVDAAISLFLAKGVRSTTIQDISKKAGVAVGTVYLYHKDKAAIVRRVAFAFAERHESFVEEVLSTRRKPQRKLLDYMLGFYDMWQPFSENSIGALELAEAVIKYAPETLEIAKDRFLSAIESILFEAKDTGLAIEKPSADAQWIALSTTAFFPLAGTPSEHPFRKSLGRNELEGLLKWILKRLEG
ncbi:TetR/AcrR family transcriptional regulator [Puniceicoccaceae bacterium K14]|nr:TetR/AcrR family transcriptional regulator [Puniceicoccaceae bacterium K14]